MTSRSLALTIAIAVASLAPAASAQAPPAVSPDAHRLAAASFQQAQAAFGRREFAAAAAAFEQAARLEPHPSPLLDAAEAWELGGDFVRAAEDCDRVLAMGDLTAEFRDEAEHRLATLGAKIATLELRSPPGIAARVDATDVALPAKKRLAPGDHVVVASRAGSEEKRAYELHLAAGETRVLDLAPPAAPSHEPVASPPAAPRATLPLAPRRTEEPVRRSGPPAGTWIAFGVAGAAAVVTGVFGAMTVSSHSAFDANPTQDEADRFYRDRAVTNVALGIAGAAAVVGAILWAASGSSATTARTATSGRLER